MSKLVDLLRNDSDIGQYTNEILDAHTDDMLSLRAKLEASEIEVYEKHSWYEEQYDKRALAEKKIKIAVEALNFGVRPKRVRESYKMLWCDSFVKNQAALEKIKELTKGE